MSGITKALARDYSQIKVMGYRDIPGNTNESFLVIKTLHDALDFYIIMPIFSLTLCIIVACTTMLTVDHDANKTQVASELDLL